MTASFDDPICEGLRVLTAYDTKALHIAEDYIVTGHRESFHGDEDDEDTVIKTWLFIDVDRDLHGAGGQEYVLDVLKQSDEGRLYLKLRKCIKGWDARGAIGDQILEICRAPQGYATKDEPEFGPLERSYMFFRDALDAECLRILELRRAIRAPGLKSHFSKDTLYHWCCKNMDGVFAARRLLKDVIQDLLYSDDYKTRDENMWQIHRALNDLPGIPDIDDLEIACVSVGAVSPDSLGPEELASALRSCGSEGWDPEDPNYRDMVIEALISYGARAILEEQYFLDERDGIPWAIEQFKTSKMMLGFQLDKIANRAGADGWDFLAGCPHMPGAASA